MGLAFVEVVNFFEVDVAENFFHGVILNLGKRGVKCTECEHHLSADKVVDHIKVFRSKGQVDGVAQGEFDFVV